MPTPTVITDLSQTAASNYPAGTDSPSVLDDVQRAHAAFIALLRDGKGQSSVQTIAGGATTDIGGVNSQVVEVTGTPTVTSFGTNYTGVRVVRFTGAAVLTHNSTLINLPGAANITTSSGDCLISAPNSTGNGWNVFSFMRASALAAVVGGDIGAATATTAALGDSSTKVATTEFVRQNGAPIGIRGEFPFLNAPAGWLKANGQTIGSASSGATSRANADTINLFTLLWDNVANTEAPIQDSTGAASTRGASAAADFAANKRFPLPDERGEFSRGWDDGRGIDVGRALLSKKLDQMQGHLHSGSYNSFNDRAGGAGGTPNLRSDGATQNTGAAVSDGTNGTPRVGTETYPRNTAWLVCIKY